jgi:glyoxylase-like metal-dependent hydrolase (beta-lactamase superfamily II)
MEIRFFNGGHCRQLLAMADRRTWRIGEFHAVFLTVAHPRHGWVLIDTGYGTSFAAATRTWPRCLYRWVTPVVARTPTAEILRTHGIAPETIRHIVLTHFHADHIGGTREFPGATFHHATEALAPLLALSAFAQTRHAFLPAQLPEDFATRAAPFPLAQFHRDPATGFPAHDLFGDGSLTLLDLPGHAPGHLGVALAADDGPLLYAADAFWHHRQIDEDISPMLPARIAIHDNRAYDATLAQLRRLARTRAFRILACHCPATQTLVSH